MLAALYLLTTCAAMNLCPCHHRCPGCCLKQTTRLSQSVSLMSSPKQSLKKPKKASNTPPRTTEPIPGAIVSIASRDAQSCPSPKQVPLRLQELFAKAEHQASNMGSEVAMSSEVSQWFASPEATAFSTRDKCLVLYPIAVGP